MDMLNPEVTMSRNFVVTGGSSGIGAAVVSKLLAAKCSVWNLDVADQDALPVNDIHCDLSDPIAVKDAIGQLPAEIDGLISVAGAAPGGVSDIQLVSINFLSVRLLIEGLIERVKPAGSIVIVASSAGRDWRENESNVSSLLGTKDYESGVNWLREHTHLWQQDAYKFSKQCAAAYTYRAAGLGRDRQVRVNCLNPGIVETQLSSSFRKMLGEQRYDEIVRLSGRAGQPDDVAEVAEYLLLGDCQWLNGVEITVDGGYYAGQIGGWITPP